MADKPLYYGSSKASGPMYYSGKGPMYYGGRQNPMYYGGGPKYGGAYGAYGSYGSYGGYGGEVDDGSLVGTITMSRMLRVVSLNDRIKNEVKDRHLRWSFLFPGYL